MDPPGLPSTGGGEAAGRMHVVGRRERGEQEFHLADRWAGGAPGPGEGEARELRPAAEGAAGSLPPPWHKDQGEERPHCVCSEPSHSPCPLGAFHVDTVLCRGIWMGSATLMSGGSC